MKGSKGMGNKYNDMTYVGLLSGVLHANNRNKQKYTGLSVYYH